MSDPVRLETRGNVGLIIIDQPPVNALGIAVRTGLADCLARALKDDAIGVLVLTGDGRGFSGGADIREFGKTPESPSLRDVIAALEKSAKPVVAALHGVTLGGGFELALGCDYRVGVAQAKVGLPEVKLGLIPGAGGTQRLPRLIGVEQALPMIVAGAPVSAHQAGELGIFDAVVDDDLVSGAVKFAQRVFEDGAKTRKLRDLAATPPEEDFFDTERKKLARRGRGLIAPWRCIDSVENATALPFDDALAKEREYFNECLNSTQSKAQRHVFFAERQAAIVPDIPKDLPLQEIKSAAVIGCGTMGGGIAMNFINAGVPVHVVETTQAALDKGLDIISRNYAASVKKGRLSQEQMDKSLALLTSGTDMIQLKDADIIVEAVFEDMALKKDIFGKLDQIAKPDAILATNTSTLDIDEIAGVVQRPENVIGMHFFSPANVMRLLENVRGGKSSDRTIATVMKLSKTIGKVGVLVGNCHGFVGNRMYFKYDAQANFMLEEGALPAQIDKVMYDFGFAMGPLGVADLAGIDVAWHVRRHQDAVRPADERYSPIPDRIYDLGRLGQKTNAGYYRYEPASRAPIADPAIEKLIGEVSSELGFERRDIDKQEIHDRCLLALINEGAKILEEGLALRASDIDTIWINGYGFPAHKGGPMFYADTLGLKQVNDALSKLYQRHGDMFKPSGYLEDLAKVDGTFNGQ